MRTRTALALAALLTLTAACTSVSPVTTSAPAPAPMAVAIDPSGKWVVALTAQGQAMDFEMELRRISGAEFGGVVTSMAFPPMNISRATLTGNTMKITMMVPTGDEGTINVVFEGDVLTGDWSMPGDGSRISGRRK